MAISVAGLLTPHYDPFAQFVSELGARGAPYAALLNWGGIIPFGIGAILFSVGFFARWHFGHLSVIGGGALMLAGVGFLTAGLFRCEAGCPYDGDLSQQVHNWSAFTAFNIMPAVALWIGIGAAWRTKRWAPLFLGGTGAVAMAGFFLAMMSAGFGHPLMGLYQRGFLVSLCLWLAGLAFFSLRNRH